jgi:hypothetical protein
MFRLEDSAGASRLGAGSRQDTPTSKKLQIGAGRKGFFLACVSKSGTRFTSATFPIFAFQW